MGISVLRRHATRYLPLLLAALAGPEALRATNTLTATPTSASLSCNTATGPGASTNIVIKAVAAPAANSPITVSFATLSGGLVVTPASAQLTNLNNSTGVTFTAVLANGCVNVVNAATPAIQFKNGATNDVSVTVTTTLTSSTSGLSVAPSGTVTVTCQRNGSSFVPGPSQTISVTSTATGGTPFTVDTVTNPAANWLTVTPTTGGTATGSAVTFTVTAASGCGGFAVNTTNSTAVHLLNAPGPDKVINVQIQVTQLNSALVPSTTSISLVCVKNGSSYYPGEAQAIYVTSAANGGTAFTIDTSTNPVASWLSLSSTTGGTATSTPIAFSAVPATGCGGYALNSINTTYIHLLNSPAPDKVITVTMQIVSATPLVATPSTATISYTKGSGTPGHVDIAVTSAASPAPFFSVETSTLPAWLTVDSVTGTAPKTIRFSSTTIADTIPPGSYSSTVRLKVSGFGDQLVTIGLLVNNAAPKLTVVEGTTRSLTWTIGTPIPSPTMTILSSDTPISYNLTMAGTLQPSVAETSGLAYNFGTPVQVSFNPLVFAAAQPNQTLTGSVSITWGTPSATVVVTFSVAVQSPGASIISLNPASLPTAAPGGVPFQVSLVGSGFVPGTDVTQRTKVGIVSGGSIVTDANIAVNIINPSNMTLTITVNSSDNTNLPFSPSGSGGSVTIGVCNPSGGTCSTPTGVAVLTIGNNPIINSVTSASALVQYTAPSAMTIAPYDMVSIWGANFCTNSGTGCSSNTVLPGVVNANTLTYPNQLTPDTSGTLRQLQVTFQTHGTSTVLGGPAPLLFATNSQINAIVPTEVCPSGSCPATVDVVVTFAGNSSAPYTVNVAATDPGMFTIGADGQGDGAVLSSAWALVSAASPAGVRNGASGSADSDSVHIYVTGLGIPDSDAGVASGQTWSANCVTVASFLGSFNTYYNTALTSLDGTLIEPGVLSSGQVPCLKNNGTDVPSVSIGGVAATVTYAGWAPTLAGSIYQIDAQLPASTAGPFNLTGGGQSAATLTAATHVPVSVTANGVTSQAGVNLWLTPMLYVTGPANSSGRTGTVGQAWPSSNNAVTALDGTTPYTYAVTSGLLPSGVTLDPNLGTLGGVPQAGSAGTYQVTVTATDANGLTGAVAFTLTVNGGLYLSTSVAGPYSATAGVAANSLTTVTAAGGVAPYTYALTTPPTGVAISSSGVVSSATTTKAGKYHLTATATDATAGTPLTGSANFDLVEALSVTKTTPTSVSAGSANAAVTTVTANAGGLSGVAHYTIATTPSTSCLTVGLTSGVVAADTSCTSGSVSVTVTATDTVTATGAYAAGTGSVTFSLTF